MLSRAGVEQSARLSRAPSRRERAESVDYEPDAEGTPQRADGAANLTPAEDIQHS